MGGQQSSQTMPASPTIQKVVDTINLKIIDQKNQTTYSLCHMQFSNQLTKKNLGTSTNKVPIDRSMNPFCPIYLSSQPSKQSTAAITCSIITPIMALVHMQKFLPKNSNKKIQEQYELSCFVKPVYKNYEEKIEVQKVMAVGEFGMLVFEDPFWRVGWAGLSYITGIDQIVKLDIRCIYHVQRVFDKQHQRHYYLQDSQKLTLLKSQKPSYSHPILQYPGLTGSLYFKILGKKPYVIGVQVNENQVRFIDQALFQLIAGKVRKEIAKRGEKNVLKDMDFGEFEIETQI